MTDFLYIPIFLQGLFIFVDELIFHRRRGLPNWEVWGHPLDTLSVAIPFGIVTLLPYNLENLWIYGALAVFSSLFVTKDEFIHAKLCEPMEHWLHSVLFLLHPISFLAAAVFWSRGEASTFLRVQFFVILSFMIYQISYWGKPWKVFQKNPAR